jgi:hypothetical protein
MGTRGLYGFYKDGVEKSTYKHNDAYPEGLGNRIFDFIRTTSIEEMNEIFDKIELVDEHGKPTDKQLVELKLTGEYSGNKEDFDWYSVLREHQGNLNAYKNGTRFMMDYCTFIYSYSCVWSYIINLDENILEIYSGGQKEKCSGRYGDVKESDVDYYPILVGTFPLDNIPANWIDIVNKKVS